MTLPDPIPQTFVPLRVSLPEVGTISSEKLTLESEALPLLGSPPLADLLTPDTRVVIAVTDSTRPSPDHLLVRLLRQQLSNHGITPENITLLCATGLHRPMKEEEAEAKFGKENLEGILFINHDATDPDLIMHLGEIDGIPVTVNRHCLEADLLIATGVVEPHQYAGFSGGAKTVVIGCGGEETISATHGLAMLEQPGTALGKVAGNPFQEFVRNAGKRIGLRYIVNLVLGNDGDIVAGACGDPIAVHTHLVNHAERICRVPVARRAAAAVVGVPASKGTNLYQASRAATYLALVEETPLAKGGPIILNAAIPEGAGKGIGEERFFKLLSSASSPRKLIEEFKRSGFPAGAQRAWIVAQTLERHPIIVVGAEHPDVVEACHMIPAKDIGMALHLAEEIVKERYGPGEHQLLLIDNGLTTLPRYI